MAPIRDTSMDMGYKTTVWNCQCNGDASSPCKCHGAQVAHRARHLPGHRLQFLILCVLDTHGIHQRMRNRWQEEGERGGIRSASRAKLPQCCSGVCISLCGGEAEQSDGLCSVLRNALTIIERDAQVALSSCKPLCSCKA